MGMFVSTCNVIVENLKTIVKSNKHMHRWAIRMMNRIRAYRTRHYAQARSSTSYDRYPEVFSFVGKLSLHDEHDNLTLLSFGCSTGEECFSLRTYLPTAQIVGLDIDRANLNTCIRRNSDSRIHFLYSNEKNLRDSSPYDMIFAMSVLCRWPETRDVDDCGRIYAFSDFENKVKLLDSVLKPGGLLVIFNANFRFTDTSTASAFEKVDIPEYLESGFVTKFGPTNKKLTEQEYPWSVFRKMSDTKTT